MSSPLSITRICLRAIDHGVSSFHASPHAIQVSCIHGDACLSPDRRNRPEHFAEGGYWMTAAILLAAAAPWLRQLFPPASIAEQIQRTPILVFAVLIFCLAAA